MSKGFNMGGMNRNQMMQQARKMQEQLLAAQQKAAETERPDGVDDSKYIEGTKQTSRLALVWLLVILLGLAAIIFLLFVSASR